MADFQNCKVVIVGAGLMGCGIAQVFAEKSIQVVIFDPFPEARDTALQKVQSNLVLQKLDNHCLSFIEISGNLQEAVRDADFVIEAALEKLPVKRDIFQQLVEATASHCILASNTSVIPIRDIAKDLQNADRIIGTHWWNPPYLVPLVEVVQSDQSAESAVFRMIELLEYVGKKPIHVKKDITGFVGNRMQHALWREAIALINEGVCDAETVDIAVKNSFGLRLPVLGPIENADLIGLDLTQDIHNVVLSDLNTDSAPSEIIQRKVSNGELGMKSGIGLRTWTPEQTQAVRQNLIEYLLQVKEKPFPHGDNQ